jgi:NTP pyrophosphatase (non-canonical NTP hydrolase)
MNKQKMIDELRNIADLMQINYDDNNSVFIIKEIAEFIDNKQNPIQDIVRLNEERYGLDFDGFNAINKLKEEMEELEQAYRKNDKIEFLDALADIVVISVGEIRKMNYDPELVLNEVVKEISSRRQDPEQSKRWANGGKEDGEKWLKDKSQDTKTLYKADFSKAKIKGE